MIARRLGTLLTVVVLAASGTYLIVYLYRWEWNRALVAGVIFVATEIALVATSVLRRLRAIEARLDLLREPKALDRLRGTAPPPKDHFEWLDPTRTNVFVPVLLGAGVILSLIGSLVERLASATTTPLRERELAARLGAVALPSGGLLLHGLPDGLGPLEDTVDRASRWRRLVPRAFGIAVAAFLLGSAIEVIADQTQDRADAPITGGSVLVAVDVENRFTARSPVRTAEALFVACRHTIGHRYQADGFTHEGQGVVAFVVRPDVGDHGRRRFEGCIEDALFDRISASVVRFDHRP